MQQGAILNKNQKFSADTTILNCMNNVKQTNKLGRFVNQQSCIKTSCNLTISSSYFTSNDFFAMHTERKKVVICGVVCHRTQWGLWDFALCFFKSCVNKIFYTLL